MKRRSLIATAGAVLGLMTAGSTIFASWNFIAEQWHMRQLKTEGRGGALQALADIGSARCVPYLMEALEEGGADPSYRVTFNKGRIEYEIAL